MEFVEAMGIMKRMCGLCQNQDTSCNRCPLCSVERKSDVFCFEFLQRYPKEAEAIIAKWNEEHPMKTRKQVLFERFPGALTDKNGAPVACALQLGLAKTLVCCGESRNGECKKCWNLPYYEETK